MCCGVFALVLAGCVGPDLEPPGADARGTPTVSQGATPDGGPSSLADNPKAAGGTGALFPSTSGGAGALPPVVGPGASMPTSASAAGAGAAAGSGVPTMPAQPSDEDAGARDAGPDSGALQH